MKNEINNNKSNHKDLHLNKNLSELRKLEFIGDSLLAFIVKDYLFHADIGRSDIRYIAGLIVSNDHLSKVFDILKLKLNPTFLKQTEVFKAKANQIEFMIYDIYLKEGFDVAKDFIIQNILINYYRLNEKTDNI